MNLQQFEHLLAVVDTGSFSRAAERLFLTQPALSRSIQTMEEELGGLLIERGSRYKTLTPLGVLVAARARRIGLEVAELKRSPTLLADLAVGSVKLGLGPAPASVLAVPLLQHMAGQYPHIKVVLSGGPAELQLQGLRSRALDALVAHRRSLPPHDDLAITLFPEMRIGFVCRRGHPLLRAGPLSFAKLRAYPLAANGIGLSDEIVLSLNAYFGDAVHFKDALQFQSDDTACLLELVRSSDTVFLGVVEVARASIDQGALVEIKLPRQPRLTSQFAFITLEGVAEAPALKIARAFCAERMHDHAPPTAKKARR